MDLDKTASQSNRPMFEFDLKRYFLDQSNNVSFDHREIVIGAGCWITPRLVGTLPLRKQLVPSALPNCICHYFHLENTLSVLENFGTPATRSALKSSLAHRFLQPNPVALFLHRRPQECRA